MKKQQKIIYTEHNGRLIFRLKARPAAGRNAVVDFLNGELVVKIKAAAQKGKANDELVSFMSKLLGTSKSDVRIVSGARSRHKALSVNSSCRQALEKLSQSFFPD